MCGGPSMNKSWQAESDHRTLGEAADIQSDKGRMTGVKKQQSKQEKKLAIMRKTMGGRSMTGGR